MMLEAMRAVEDIASRTLGGIVSRTVHEFGQAPAPPATPLEPEGSAVLGRVARDLAAARVLKDWWEARGVEGRFAEKVPLTRSFNRPDSAFAFFDTIPCRGGDYP